MLISMVLSLVNGLQICVPDNLTRIISRWTFDTGSSYIVSFFREIIFAGAKPRYQWHIGIRFNTHSTQNYKAVCEDIANSVQQSDAFAV